MTRRARSSLRLSALLTAAVGLVGASSALGADAPTGVSSNPTSPSFAQNWAFSWDAMPPTGGGSVSYQGGIVTTPGEEPLTLIAPGVTIVPPEGNVFFKVRSLETGQPDSAYTTLAITVDRTAPTFSGVSLDGTAGLVSGWFRAPLSIDIVGCADNLNAGSACASKTWNTEGGLFPVNTQTVTLTDAAGNSAFAPLPEFGYDSVRPTSGIPVAPGELVAAEPTFEWAPGSDATSGVDHYDVVFTPSADFDTEYPAGGQVIARQQDDGRVGDYGAPRDPALRPSPLPPNTALKWWIRTFDKAGNLRNSSQAFNLTIDPTVPPAPTITGGPNAPTQDTAPTFTWQGAENNFHWEVNVVGSQTPIRQGGGPATQTTVAALPDGDYVFRLTQITEAGQGSAEASRSFKVDTTPPAPPTITARPTFPAIGITPLFAWQAEPGAYSRWSVFDGAGTPVVGPIDTPITSAELPPLAEGSYTFQVVQVDAAGNVSAPTAEAFTVLAPLAVPTQNARAAFLAALPKQNALRLQPKAGTTLPTLRPLLRWKKGPRGTKLYNLQIFKVTARKGTAKPKITKVLSRFPRGLTFRTPKKNLVPGTCYVWRVWPYTGRAFTTRPVGVSNFCIAGKKVLRIKALRAANRSKAK